MPPHRPSRRNLDTWFPTLARYVGLVLLVYAAVVDRGRNPTLIPAGVGLALLKTVVGNGNGS